MNILSIFAVALLVSIDSFFIGMHMGTKKGFKLGLHISIMSIIVLVFCFAAFGLGVLLNRFVDFNIGYLAGAVLVLLGANSILETQKPDIYKEAPNKLPLKTVFLIGFFLALDGAFAVMTITASYKTVVAPITVAGLHIITSLIGGLFTTKIKFNQNIQNILSGSCLILLGYLNLFSVL